MPPKMQEQQHRRDGSPDDKKGKVGEKAKEQKDKMKHGGRDKGDSDDEGAMEKLKDKMGGMFSGGKDEKRDGKEDKKDEKKDGKKDDKKDNSGRARSRSRSKSRERRRSGSKSPQRKGDGPGHAQGQGQGHGQQQAMKMGAGAGAGAGVGAAAANAGDNRGGKSPERHGQGHGQGHGGPQGGAAAKGPAGGNHKSRTKRGLCWPVENKKDDPSRFTRPGSKVSWYYNWSPHPTKDTGNLQFIPMQWNAGGIKELQQNVNRNTEAKTMMAFNEPELKDQANMSPDDAAEQWLKFVEPLRKQGVRCGSPAISSAGHAVGWMKDFWGKVKKGGSDVDFWCFHWYGTDLGPFYDYIWSTHNQLDPSKKAWITEFACTNWNKDNPLPKEQVLNFAKESFKYLDSLDWVERYCWFAPTRDIGNVGKFARMYNDEGNLTDVGKAFRDE